MLAENPTFISKPMAINSCVTSMHGAIFLLQSFELARETSSFEESLVSSCEKLIIENIGFKVNF